MLSVLHGFSADYSNRLPLYTIGLAMHEGLRDKKERNDHTKQSSTASQISAIER
jgi:hypothetical protein